MDPQCGWCYANAKNILKFKNSMIRTYDFELVLGGMWLAENAPKGGKKLFKFIGNHAPQMERLTRCTLSPKYYELTEDKTYTFSSLEPSASIQYIKKHHPELVFEFAEAVQHKLMGEGKCLDAIETFQEIFEQLSIPFGNFEQEWLSEDNLAACNHEFITSKYYGNSFPATFMQQGNKVEALIQGYFDADKLIGHLS